MANQALTIRMAGGEKQVKIDDMWIGKKELMDMVTKAIWLKVNIDVICEALDIDTKQVTQGK